MTELWLIRHGETTRSEGARLAGWDDVPLTPRGEDQARALRPLLDGGVFASVWSSDLSRAVATARLAWGEPQPERRLREICFGSLEGRRYDELPPEINRSILKFRDFAVPDGESVSEMAARVNDFVDHLAPGRHLIFAHGGVIRVLTRDLGVDRFVPTGTVVGIDHTQRRLLFVHEPAGEE